MKAAITDKLLTYLDETVSPEANQFLSDIVSYAVNNATNRKELASILASLTKTAFGFTEDEIENIIKSIDKAS